ncbi:hypothetical protein L2E82_22803 [Cichorium intybus]|uniref:Uncharacterized protein n=1 Tax=Cichorium intybus TaxID=13427 RepID=A0ACB9DYS2_CICIN|nr:hypothetical protein L2E82_22803 [Cichorium intybus]
MHPHNTNILLFCLLTSLLSAIRATRNLTLPYQHPNPEAVVQEVQRRLNVSIYRREMLDIGGDCLTGNPIDDCWKCDPNWGNDRQRLADCGIGFGRFALGGKGGQYYIVTDSSDNDVVNPTPGTLRYAVTFAFNHFGKGLIQRMPRCRHGYFHVVNNDFTEWKMYAIGGSANPTINSQGNRYIAPPDPNAKENIVVVVSVVPLQGHYGMTLEVCHLVMVPSPTAVEAWIVAAMAAMMTMTTLESYLGVARRHNQDRPPTPFCFH